MENTQSEVQLTGAHVLLFKCDSAHNLDPRALLLTDGEKISREPFSKVSSHWFS